MPTKDLTGKKIGLWTVVESVPTDKKYSSWKCRCDCGSEEVFTTPGIRLFNDASSCGCTRDTYIAVGERFKSSSGSFVTVLEKLRGGYSVNCEYEDGTQQVIATGNLRNGSFKNPNEPSVAGLGFIGVGDYSSGSHKEFFERWYSIFRRVYLEGDKARNSSYSDSFICEEWYNFQNFAKWMEQASLVDKSWHLDKDLLVKGNKEYGPELCVFLPPEINTFFTKRKTCRGATPIGVYFREKTGRYLAQFTKNSVGTFLGSYSTPEAAFAAYKKAKESHAKELGEKWKNELDPRAYEALMCYTVEITD